MKIIKIGAMWCPGCLIMNPRWKSLEKTYPKIVYETYDYDMDEEIVKQWNPGNILPIIIIFDKKNKEIKRLIGEIKEKELLKIVGELYEKD